MLKRESINAALKELRASTRPKGESQAKFAQKARIKDGQVAQVMRGGGILSVPAMEGWVKACGVQALSQFIAKLELEAQPETSGITAKESVAVSRGRPQPTESPPRKRAALGPRSQRA